MIKITNIKRKPKKGIVSAAIIHKLVITHCKFYKGEKIEKIFLDKLKKQQDRQIREQSVRTQG